MLGVFEQLGLDPAVETPGRQVVRHIGESLVAAMQMAAQSGKPEAAQLVAGECVTLAETKDHLNWELIGTVAEKATGDAKEALKAACDAVEDQEDEHLYHSTYTSVVRFLYRRVWDLDRAQDLAQAVFVRAVAPRPEKPRAWVCAVAA